MNESRASLRPLRILELFADVRKPLRLKEVAEKLGFATSTTLSLLRALTDAGYMTFDRASWMYFPSNRIPDLGVSLSTVLMEERFLLQMMESLQILTRELVVVGTPNDVFVDFIRSLRSLEEIQLYTPAGTRYLMVQCGMGLLLMSRMESSIASRIYRRTISEGWLDVDAFPEEVLFERLDKMRGKEFVFTRADEYITETGHSGGAMISSVIPTLPNNRPLILGIGGPANRLSLAQDSIIMNVRAEMAKLADLLFPHDRVGAK